jgi:hypothetical protein
VLLRRLASEVVPPDFLQGLGNSSTALGIRTNYTNGDVVGHRRPLTPWWWKNRHSTSAGDKSTSASSYQLRALCIGFGGNNVDPVGDNREESYLGQEENSPDSYYGTDGYLTCIDAMDYIDDNFQIVTVIVTIVFSSLTIWFLTADCRLRRRLRKLREARRRLESSASSRDPRLGTPSTRSRLKSHPSLPRSPHAGSGSQDVLVVSETTPLLSDDKGYGRRRSEGLGTYKALTNGSSGIGGDTFSTSGTRQLPTEAGMHPDSTPFLVTINSSNVDEEAVSDMEDDEDDEHESFRTARETHFEQPAVFYSAA